MKKIIVIFFLVGFICNSYSQSIFSKDHKRFSIDLYTGLNSFHGDIKGKAGFTFGTKFNWYLTSAFSLYSSLDFSSLNGYDKKRNDRFSNSSFKMMFGSEAYLFNILRFKEISSTIQPFFGLAFGAIKSNFSKSNISGIDLEELQNEWALCHQYSGGVKIKLTNNIDIQVRIAFSYTKTDALDNFKPNVPTNKKNDSFNEYSVGVTYHFGENNKSPIIWKSTENTIFGFNTSKLKIRKKEVKTDAYSTNQSATSENAEEPIIIDISEPTYQDVDENEFDCIIKY